MGFVADGEGVGVGVGTTGCRSAIEYPVSNSVSAAEGLRRDGMGGSRRVDRGEKRGWEGKRKANERGTREDAPNHSSVHHRVLNTTTRRCMHTDFPSALRTQEEGRWVVLEGCRFRFSSGLPRSSGRGSTVDVVREEMLGVCSSDQH